MRRPRKRGPEPTWKPWFRFLGWSFLLAVIVPTVATGLYCAVIASNEYVVTARFAVRGPSASESQTKPDDKAVPEAARSLVTALSGRQGTSPTALSAYVVASFAQSAELVAELDRGGRLRSMFGDPGVDFFHRLDRSAPIEKLASYWEGRVSATVQRLSGMVTLEVRTFRPDDAMELCDAIIRASERVVSAMSARRQADAVRLAESELGKAETRYVESLHAVSEFRRMESNPDHLRSIEALGKTLLQLEMERIKLRTEKSAVLSSLSPNASSLQPVNARLSALDREIQSLRDRFASDRAQARSVATSMNLLEGLEVERYFAQKLYEMATSSLSRARDEAQRQSDFLTVLVPPAHPDRPAPSEALASSALVFLIALFSWGLAMLVIAGIRDQRS